MQISKKIFFAVAALALLAARLATAQDAAATLKAASEAMGAGNVTSIEYQGSGSSYNFGQAINVAAPWRHLIMKNYVADIQYGARAMQEEMDRTLVDGSMPFGGFHQILCVSGSDAWNFAGEVPTAAPAPVAAMERQLQIWLTPIGFLKAAEESRATVKTQGANKVITFTTADHHRVEGTINTQNLVTKTETWIDDPVLGDMPIVTTFSNYARFGDLTFPAKIVQTEGGYPVLELAVSDVKANAAKTIDVPANVRGVQAPPVVVKTEKLGDGVWFLGGGAYNSLLVEFDKYTVVVEGPLNEARSAAVIDEAHKLVPNKPIKYMVNTHNHFDHLGGIRTFVAEGSIIIAPGPNVAYYHKILLLPHTIHPDRLSRSPKPAVIEGVKTKRVLTDGKQTLEIYVTPIKGHSDAMIVTYSPELKLLTEADAYVPMPLSAPPSAKPDSYFLPFTVDLNEQLRRLKLDVGPIAPIHGRMTSMDEMLRMIGKSGG